MSADPISHLNPADPDEYVVVPKDTLRCIIDRLNHGMRTLPLGAAGENLDATYIDMAVAWSHARRALGEHDGELYLAPAVIPLTPEPCQGCMERCGQCK